MHPKFVSFVTFVVENIRCTFCQMKQMRKVIRVSLMALSLFMCACSPRVTSEVLLERPAQHPDSVVVYEVGEFVPNSAEVVGNVSVRDRGTTTKCKYDYVVHLAKQRTAECGGNALLLTEHREPSFRGGTCHQIWGKMLLLKDRHVYYDSYNPVMETVAQEASIRRSVGVGRVRVPVPANVVKLNVGASQITSEIETPIGTYKRKWGTDVQLQYEHFWKSNFGLFAVADHAEFTFDDLGTMTSNAFCGGLAWAGMLGKFRLCWDFGIGYGYSDDGYDGDRQGGFAMFVGVTMEYMLSQHVGLGVDLNALSNRWKKPEGMQLKKNEMYGMQRTNVLGGVRFYF